ncbi:MAG: hypothetical protein ACAH88_14425, partial [Roseimicrobium sp.]
MRLQDGKVEKNVTLKPNIRLNAVAVGADENSPLLLVEDVVVSQRQMTDEEGRPLIHAEARRETGMLKAGTMEPAALRGLVHQDQLVRPLPGTSDEVYGLSHVAGPDVPHLLSTSRDGRTILLTRRFMTVVDDILTTCAWSPNVMGAGAGDTMAKPGEGSLTGLVGASSQMRLIRAGNYLQVGEPGRTEVVVASACGRYALVASHHPLKKGPFEIRSVENNEVLLKLGRLNLPSHEMGYVGSVPERRLRWL